MRKPPWCTLFVPAAGAVTPVVAGNHHLVPGEAFARARTQHAHDPQPPSPVPPVSTAAAASFSGFRPTLRLWHIGAMTDEAQDRRLAMLMAAAQAGDRESYQAVLRACVPVAAAAARRQGHAPDAVDDVVQEVLLTVHRALATYDPARPFGPWLQSIASRRAVDAWRRHGRAGGREVHDPDAYLAHADSAPDADSQAYAGFRSEALRAAVARLPAGQREAIELIGLGEKSLEEAAVVTGRSKGALKVNFHRAIKALRTLMAPAGDV